MIYQPRNVSPTQTSVDANVANNYFSMEINTNDKVTAYQLTILNWDNTTRYVQDKVTLDTPLYNGDTLAFLMPSSSTSGVLINGYDYKWYVKLYQDTSNMYITYGIVQSVVSSTQIQLQININIKEGMILKCLEEERTITSYNSTTGIATINSAFTNQIVAGIQYQIYSNFIQTVPEYILHVRKTPDVDITTIPSSITTKNYTFTGTYTQENNVPLTYHQWTLGVATNTTTGEYTLVQTTGRIYNCNLTYTYDGFKNGVTYTIILETENEYGITNYVQKYFTVSYNEIEYTEKPAAQVDYYKNAIQLDWVAPTEISPTVWNANIFAGRVLPGTIGTNSFYIQKGVANITKGNILLINNAELKILSYDSTTGLVTTQGTLPESVVEGNDFSIQGYDGATIASSMVLYRNTPYQNTNSLDTLGYKLIYERENDAPIGNYPDDWEITMQFKPDTEFFYGAVGVFRNIVDIATIESDASDGVTGMILIFIHTYDVVGAYPETKDGVANIQTLGAPPSGSTNTYEYAYLNETIDLTTTSYIYFPEYSYLEKISSFDSSTKKATFENSLPFLPSEGDKYVMMVTLSIPFYSNPNNQWLLQNANSFSSSADYRWIDNENVWDDTKVWTEGGTAIVRVAESWWKVKLTNEAITLEKGGI